MPADAVTLVRDGVPSATLVVAPNAAPPERFAAEELQRYIEQISGARLPLAESMPASGLAIHVGARPHTAADRWDDAFTLDVMLERVVVAGRTPRATLFAAYTLLERLGCRWLAPNFAFYPGGRGEVVPRETTLTLPQGRHEEKPALRYRAKYVEEGLTHTPLNLPALVDWMAKTRHNVFSCPHDYGGSGRCRWDGFRDALTPELDKRGLFIEVGGHGYQNYLPADRYFDAHPDWFGQDEEGKRTRAVRRVFATSNPDALAEFTRNIVAYLRARPEIDIFDLWPPDVAEWSTAAEDVALGSPPVRHARVVNHVADVLAKELPGVTLECLAYASYLEPPKGIAFAPNILIGFCPINQSFTTSLTDATNDTNRNYWNALTSWEARPDTRGSLYLYSYYRKYAWRSLPILVPHGIAQDMAACRKAGVIGLSSYSEPGDWFTYELQHYALAHAAWKPHLDADSLITDYCRARFGLAAAPAMVRFFTQLEKTVPRTAAIPGTPMPTPQALADALRELDTAHTALDEATRAVTEDPARASLLARWWAVLEYARLEVERRLHPERAAEYRDKLALLVAAHKNDGLYVNTPAMLKRFAPPPKP